MITTIETSKFRFDINKPVRSSLYKGNGRLTGKKEIQDWCGEPVDMYEVDYGFGIDFIFEDLLSQ